MPTINQLIRKQRHGLKSHNKVPALRKIAKDFVDATESKYARLDGQPLQDVRVKSPTFAYTLPAENSLYHYYAANYDPVYGGPQYQGTIQPVVSDGYWVAVPPLAPGEHTLKLAAAARALRSTSCIT